MSTTDTRTGNPEDAGRRNLLGRVYDTVAPTLVVLTFVLGVAALGGVVNQQIRANQQQERNTQFQRDVLCGLVEPYAAGPEPSTPQGSTYWKSANRTKTLLQCTPDPTDGR